MYIAKELWHGRSARDESPKDVGRGMWRSVNELMLVRYVFLVRFNSDEKHTWSNSSRSTPVVDHQGQGPCATLTDLV